MRESDMNIFVGVGAFAIGLLYFYVLTLSILVTFWGLMSWWLVVAGWILLFAVLYGEKYINQKIGQSGASLLVR
ncbi:MAG: hypothetical protein ACHQRJ_19670 [Alphaproteobacteria bacterium]|nr:hypothetical protein [Alphaproteobacteria bacterium]